MKTSATRVASRFLQANYDGNPDGSGIYAASFDHGYDEPLAGGTDVMRKLQNKLLEEQGREPRPESPRLAAKKVDREALVAAHITSDIKSKAESIAKTLKDDKDKAHDFVEQVFAEMNFHAVARAVSSSGAGKSHLTSAEFKAAAKTSAYLNHDGEDATAFASALFTAMGDTAGASKIVKAILKVESEIFKGSNA